MAMNHFGGPTKQIGQRPRVQEFKDASDLSTSAWVIDPHDLVLMHKVGSGCTAEVYLGTYNDKAVAIKQITWNKDSAWKKALRAFDREMAIMTRIQHPNLVELYGAATHYKPLHVVTEFCSGGCLFELLHNCDHIEITWPQKYKILLDVACAMEYLHAKGIIHRDLKSLNMLLQSPLQSESDIPICKVTDFGLSRMKETHDEWGSMTSAVGTCHWMAPEVLNSTHYDQSADVYSFGMIMFEVICREIPFEEEEPAQVRLLTAQGVRPDMDAVPPDAREGSQHYMLVELMQRCWAAEPTDRPPFSEVVEIIFGGMTEYGDFYTYARDQLAIAKLDLPAKPGPSDTMINPETGAAYVPGERIIVENIPGAASNLMPPPQ